MQTHEIHEYICTATSETFSSHYKFFEMEIQEIALRRSSIIWNSGVSTSANHIDRPIGCNSNNYWIVIAFPKKNGCNLIPGSFTLIYSVFSGTCIYFVSN